MHENNHFLEQKNDKRNNILEAALDIFLEKGYQGFTIRNVADQAKVHFSSIRYYFKNKEKLLHGLLDYKLFRDSQLLQSVIDKEGISNKERFIDTIDLILRINRQPEIINFFLELSTLSRHKTIFTKDLDGYYSVYFDWIVELINIVNPSLIVNEQKIRASLIIAILEGYMCTYNLIKKYRPAKMPYEKRIIDLAWNIATKK